MTLVYIAIDVGIIVVAYVVGTALGVALGRKTL